MYAHHAWHRTNMPPHEFYACSDRVKAFMKASIDLVIKEEQKAAKK